MRRKPTPQEARLWQELRVSKLDGVRFSRQVVVGGLIADFACRGRMLMIEIDGDTHDPARDRDRDYMLGRQGWRVLRFTNSEIGSNLAGVLETIRDVALSRPTKLQRLTGTTHPPAPSLCREGEFC